MRLKRPSKSGGGAKEKAGDRGGGGGGWLPSSGCQESPGTSESGARYHCVGNVPCDPGLVACPLCPCFPSAQITNEGAGTGGPEDPW